MPAVSVEQISPPRRDPLAYAPLFVLAPARSNSTVVTAMIGNHPQLYGFPELALFRQATVGELLTDPPGWHGQPARLRLAGLLRALAQVHAGAQTEETVADAARWVEQRVGWTVAEVCDHLLAGVAPLVGTENTPENSSREDFFERLVDAYPRARFLHLTRHPVPTVRSMMRVWSGKGYWSVPDRLFPQFCLGLWLFQHTRIHMKLATLPPGRALQVRSEDVLNAPLDVLPQICRWLGVDESPRSIEPMLAPERSPYAGLGPEGARAGGDFGFFRDPVRRPAEVPETLDLPPDWVVDPWLVLAVTALAIRLGYGAAPRV